MSRSGYLNFSLHAHLPYVVNHGVWPHGLEWLLEAAAETYLPLLRMLGRLRDDSVAATLNMDFSPVLLEQLAHPIFQMAFPDYLARKLQYAHEDEAFFQQAQEWEFAEVARFWQRLYQEAIDDNRRLGGDLIGEFRRLADAGRVELLTCLATHGYAPLLGTDESLRAQVRMAMQTHRRHFGRAPRGMWLPECGYRPAGYWQVPVMPEGEPQRYPNFYRIGVEEALRESAIDYFFVDAHLIDGSGRFASPYAMPGQSAPLSDGGAGSGDARLYRTYAVEGAVDQRPVAVFPRDPRTGFQVWSGDAGYPADAQYLDFHKKRWPGGHRYWRVTGPQVDLGAKERYSPSAALLRAHEHARHFVELAGSALAGSEGGVLCAPFDAELFGHWWFEGVHFLEEVLRRVAASEQLEAVNSSAYLRRSQPAESIAMPEGSWGAGGDNRVWLNDDTSWTYAELYRCEHEAREVCTEGGWRDGGLGERIVKQICRELLLLESSDWPFLITTGSARDYAQKRFRGHLDAFNTMLGLWHRFDEQGRSLRDDQMADLKAAEEVDQLFPDVNPEFWVRGARAEAGVTA